jgi:hypothetical protein
MNTRCLGKYIFFLLVTLPLCTSHIALGQDTSGKQQEIKERLAIPFGTLAKMEVEVVDGDALQKKALQGIFLFKVKTVDSVRLTEPVIIAFKDETGDFPGDLFALHKYLYHKKAGTIAAKQQEKLKKEYVGKTFTIVAYETGGFVGLPDGYFEYQPVKQDYSFHFRQHVVVVANLSKKAN